MRTALQYAAAVVLLMIGIASGKRISSIEIESQVYITEAWSTPSLYVVSSSDRSQVGDAKLVPGLEVGFAGLKVRKVGTAKQLLTLIQGNSVELASLEIPFSSKRTLPVLTRSIISQQDEMSLEPTWDTTDNVLIVSTGRKISLVDIDTMQVLDSAIVWASRRTLGRNVVYNRVTKRILTFQTTFASTGLYTVDVGEYDVTNRTLTEVDTTYSCMCEDQAELSPFFEVYLSDCQMDYDRNKIWCAAGDHAHLFAFKADDLSQFQIIHTGNLTFNRVQWDFDDKKAYLIDSFNKVGFAVHKINLLTGAVLGSYTDLTTLIDPNVAKKDLEKSHLYIAVRDYDDVVPPKVVIVNTKKMTAKKLILRKTDNFDD